MSTDTLLTKRRAHHAGELGFFPDNPMAEEDLLFVKDGDEVVVRWYSPRNLEGLKFLWGLVHKVAEATDRYLDKDEAMQDLKLRAAFTKVVYDNKKKELELRPKSLTRVSNEQLKILTAKIVDIIIRELLPHMKASQLREEVEEMMGLRK